MSTNPIPVHVLSGFLGTGKTTLLVQALEHSKQNGKQTAVIMNEIGDVNLDGMLVSEDVPMEELLSGCICCTIRGDLGMALRELVQTSKPDVIFIESSGIANPVEIIDGVTDASLIAAIELRSIVTVVDAPQMLKAASGKTKRLLEEQIRCATSIILNKTDLISKRDVDEAEQCIGALNAFATIYRSERCRIDYSIFDTTENTVQIQTTHSHDSDGHEHPHVNEEEHAHGLHNHGNQAAHHHTHEHVMAYTHYFTRPVNSEQLEQLIAELPDEVYRAKGIVEFTDTSSRFMFHYAYRELDFIKINPQGQVPNVAVFIGEHFSQDKIQEALERL
jgi:G3E family GTPase